MRKIEKKISLDLELIFLHQRICPTSSTNSSKKATSQMWSFISLFKCGIMVSSCFNLLVNCNELFFRWVRTNYILEYLRFPSSSVVHCPCSCQKFLLLQWHIFLPPQVTQPLLLMDMVDIFMSRTFPAQFGLVNIHFLGCFLLLMISFYASSTFHEFSSSEHWCPGLWCWR